MTYTFQPQGVCSRAMMVEVDEQGVIQEMQVLGDIHYAWDAAQNCIIFQGVTEHQTDEAFMTQWKEIMEEYTNDDNLIYD